MSDRPLKHSITLHGHRTSVSLEDDFWQALQEIAALEGRPLAALAAEIDAARAPDTGLATAIRLHVLRHFRHKAS
ncbi:Ribbon-helix-helix domain-containing protein [Gemmobacter megaterium]|uniref:Ribbon-helix-helix domain-containing protein n=1 Tax=Gemmobacter megaterium TaxID=1086013 RepID=A0A1N7NPC2_9RHOB|nr:ribbon-helix-helix domain-containing protein [Gemmobacter megaterium]GGE17543.1 aryl-sulfate sulfotransferase [Gemmobacter megaterium]SIT00176.1 Ribbon-helix-helix domain-containing protein [Gemmobacter megaterium]